jgi:16S rRNA A1518/A1519 N6-dimethyltransferase RsmA/KsgA/DIM1 with predicted DNA glycosylase/AP lyase activity
MTELPLRETFNTAAARYHRARPGYPEELFDDLADLARLDGHSRILEIGPGTGIATAPLARRGYSILGIELGPALASEARKNLNSYPNVTIETGSFETYPL